MPTGTSATRPRWKTLWLLVVLTLVLSTVVTGAAVAKPKADTDEASRGGVAFWLTIPHNNDGESQVLNAGSSLEDLGGTARFQTVVDSLKSDAAHGPWIQRGAKHAAVMISSGDNSMAGSEFNASLTNGVPFYDTITMELIGYDAVNLGNRDFDFSPDVLADFLAGGRDQYPYRGAAFTTVGVSYQQALRNYIQNGLGGVIKVADYPEAGEGRTTELP